MKIFKGFSVITLLGSLLGSQLFSHISSSQILNIALSSPSSPSTVGVGRSSQSIPLNAELSLIAEK